MPNDQKNQNTQGNKSKGMQNDKSKSGAKGVGQPVTGHGHTTSSGNKANPGNQK